MSIKARVLCDNYVFLDTGAIAEHGWSIFLETPHGNYLFDTGQGKAILNNARVFAIDLSTIKAIMLSHRHFDHTGGLRDVLSVVDNVAVYAHADIFKAAYHLRDGKLSYIGVPFSQEFLEGNGATFYFNRGWKTIAPGMELTGEIPRNTSFEIGEDKLIIKTENGVAKDPMIDDQSLVFTTEKGLFIILGCAHSGIINILNHIIEHTGQSHIHTIIGGTHLGPLSEDQLEQTITALKDFDIEHIGVSHCTGMIPSLRLAEEFGDKFFFCHVGTEIEV